ncbi:DNA-3-methyladenine glycosylase family protein [Falsiroseomonas sp. E2-1-a20]|uniref:DNA-3-methyladenine glycosylase family protein n=1 Tax=Falsiroseomonas sp. E2-1-a20 TaxID=3239300 RepID=UPI003F3888A5
MSPPPASPPPNFPAGPAWARQAVAALVAADPDLAAIEAAAGPLPWRSRPAGFGGLLRTICGQQISNQAAGAIWRRLSAIPGALDPAGLVAMEDDVLCGVGGLSRPKAAHARALAAACLDGSLRLDRLGAMADEEAVAHLSAVRGLGRWTSEVHLLFAHDRPDIFPSGDIALAASVAQLKRLQVRPAPKELARIALAWAPWRGVAARLFWHHWRHVTGRPIIEDDPAAALPAPAGGGTLPA